MSTLGIVRTPPRFGFATIVDTSWSEDTPLESAANSGYESKNV